MSGRFADAASGGGLAQGEHALDSNLLFSRLSDYHKWRGHDRYRGTYHVGSMRKAPVARR